MLAWTLLRACACDRSRVRAGAILVPMAWNVDWHEPCTRAREGARAHAQPRAITSIKYLNDFYGTAYGNQNQNQRYYYT